MRRMICIGMNKSATTTIGSILHNTGHKMAPQDTVMAWAALNGIYGQCLGLARNFTGFEDRPWNCGDLYQQMAQHDPEAGFILPIRDGDDWWQSVERWLVQEYPDNIPLYMAHLGVERFEKQAFLDAYTRFNLERISWFDEHHPDRLLVLNMNSITPLWPEIANFIGFDPPKDMAFPRANPQDHSVPIQNNLVNAATKLKEHSIRLTYEQWEQDEPCWAARSTLDLGGIIT